MKQLLYGSINFDALMKAIKSGKVKTFKTESGSRFVHIKVWINDRQDQYGNDASIQTQLKDDLEGEKSDYIGNLRLHVKKDPVEATAEDFADIEDDLPF